MANKLGMTRQMVTDTQEVLSAMKETLMLQLEWVRQGGGTDTNIKAIAEMAASYADVLNAYSNGEIDGQS